MHAIRLKIHKLTLIDRSQIANSLRIHLSLSEQL